MIKLSFVFFLILTSAHAHVGLVDCGKVKSVKINKHKEVSVKIYELQDISFIDGKDIQYNAPIKESVKKVLYPTRLEAKESIKNIEAGFNKLNNAKDYNLFVCVLYSFEKSDFETGFPYIIEVGDTLEKAVNKLTQ